MTPCILWEKAKSKAGYGQRGVNGKVYYVHRLEYEKHHGPIPEGMVIRHTCDNPACYNIEHLLLGTQKENMADMYERGRENRNAAKGTKQHLAKLDDDKVRYILASTKTGLALARELGVTKHTIYRVRSGKTWRHING